MQAAMYAKSVASGSSRQATPLIAEALAVLQLTPDQVTLRCCSVYGAHDSLGLRDRRRRLRGCPLSWHVSNERFARCSTCWRVSLLGVAFKVLERNRSGRAAG